MDRLYAIKEKLQSIGEGELSISAYDTAWVSLVEDNTRTDTPLFPTCLEWIINNQLPDGSWGDRHYFNAYDRLSCTLACVVALKRWNINPKGVRKGLDFLVQNLHALQDEDPEHILSGFEVTFTSLIQLAKTLELEGLENSAVLEDLYHKRELKLKRIPKEILYNVPTTLLHSLEGIPDLDWEKLLKLQHPNGSFLCSPSSTAYALMNTADEKCFNYLREIVERFDGGVPHSYPMDLFERLWVVDRLDRLSRYFKSEIKEFLDYVHGFWTSNGISWSRNTVELDIDDTSMGFRILRLHGYDVNAKVFQHFKRESQFFCFVGQTSQGITEMLSLLRASHVSFPGEKILDEAKDFAFRTLKEKQELGQVADRWIITKNLGSEVNITCTLYMLITSKLIGPSMNQVRYYLDIPWYAILPRIETRYYIDIYGGDADVWIAKVLYRMYNISNNYYLDLAKLDYNYGQKLHQLEWIDIKKWYNDLNLVDFGVTEDALLRVYFLAMSSIFEPERATERIGWAQTQILTDAVSFYFERICNEEKKNFIQTFLNTGNESWNLEKRAKCKGFRYSEAQKQLVEAVLRTLSNISLKVATAPGEELYRGLKHCWNTWLLSAADQEDEHLVTDNEAELIVVTINLCGGHNSSISFESEPEYMHLARLTNDICNHLHQGNQQMQELLQLVMKGCKEMDQEIKLTFLTVAKSYCYNAYCSPTSIDRDIAKVLFEIVV
ncbi:muconate cycloisomerase [Ranunculus cassubicifolius]